MRPSQWARRSSSSATGSDTEAIAPWPDSASSALLRSATILAASDSDSAPATQAAAISPWLCPMTARGSIP